MPKLGMGPVRREQIFRAVAKIIAEEGFDGTTMRMVAEEAGVSTGMLNHYFANRMEMLEETLVFVSTRQQDHEAAALDALEPGEARLRALVRSVLPTDQRRTEAWRVWIAARGASVALPELRRVMAARNALRFGILSRALQGIVPADDGEKIPYAWQLDALMNGLVIQAMTTEADMSFPDIEDAVVAAALERGRAAPNGRTTRSPRRAAQA
jgi:AcrR family transcriptional regulator